jgi:hypothetical protein
VGVSKPFFSSSVLEGIGALGIGFIKGLFERIAQYQRSYCGFKPRTSLSAMSVFVLRGGSDRPIVLGSGKHGAPLWGVGRGNGQRRSVGSTEPESGGRLGGL